MNRFLWLVRREIWEHKAIWVAPLIVIGCLVLLVLTGNVHLGPFGGHGRRGHVRARCRARCSSSCSSSSTRASRSSCSW